MGSFVKEYIVEILSALLWKWATIPPKSMTFIVTNPVAMATGYNPIPAKGDYVGRKD